MAPEGSYIACNECNSLRFFRRIRDLSKPLPVICRCAKTEAYEKIEITECTLVTCKACCIICEVRLSDDYSRYELWSVDQCPSCHADAVRFSRLDSGAYVCDDCGIQFRVDEKDQRSFESRFGSPYYVSLMDDPLALRAGDLIALDDLQSDKLLFVMDRTEHDIFIVDNNLHQDYKPVASFPPEFYRVEFLPHDRYSSMDAVATAQEAVGEGFSIGQYRNVTGYLKAAAEIETEFLRSLKVKGSNAVESCKMCGQPVCRSAFHEFKAGKIVLWCTACERNYSVPDNQRVRQKLSSGQYGESCGSEKVTDISQIGPGDLLSFGRWSYSHHALCTKIDKKSDSVDVVEFIYDKFSTAPRIVERKDISFEEDIKPKHVRVLRFMPLDCLPIDRVLTRALKLAMNPSLQQSYSAFSNNCQHFASWCKTDQMKSKDGVFYRKVCGYASLGLNIASVFVPGLKWVCQGLLIMECVFLGMKLAFEPPQATESYEGMSLPPAVKETNAFNAVGAIARKGLKTALSFL